MTAGIIFDLDGTLVDTAPDMGGAINSLLLEHNRAPLSPLEIRNKVSQGVKGLLKIAFDCEPDNEK